MPNFTYHPGIPDAPNNPSDDQPLMKTNTDSINSILNEDMIGFGNSNGGFHSKVTYVNQGSDPGSAAAQFVLYSKLLSGVSQLFFQRDGVATVFPLTGPFTASAQGTITLPGGIIIKWGTANANSAGTVQAFSTAFTTNCFVVLVQSFDTGYTDTITVTTVTAASFYPKRDNGSGNTGVYYIAIGN